MIVDSSAIFTVINREPGWESYVSALDDARTVRMSAANLLEVSIVADNAGDPMLGRRLDEFLVEASVEVVEVTEEQARVGRAAHRDFGRGSGHPARLNFGDCFAYALAKVTREPLLFRGDDFSHTDVRSALG